MKTATIYLLSFIVCGCICTDPTTPLETAFDIVIVADSTDFVGYLDWALEQTVIKNIFSIFRIGTCYTRVLGLVRYGTEAADTVPLVDIKYSNNYNVEKHLDEIGLLGGNTSNLAAGLDNAVNIFGGCYDRPNILNLAIIVTSSNNCSKEILEGASTRLKGVAYVVTYALDVGRNIQQDEVDLLTDDKTAQLHYSEYNDAVKFFNDLGNFTKGCGITDCQTCPAFYIPGELQANNSAFIATLSRKGVLLDSSNLMGGNKEIVLKKNNVITISRPDRDSKVSSFTKLKSEDLTSFKFYKICFETLYAKTIYIGDIKRKTPLWITSIKDEVVQHWTRNCEYASTFYTWKKLRMTFEVPENSVYGDHSHVLMRNLYMEGCYSSKKVPVIKEPNEEKRRKKKKKKNNL